MDNENIFVTLPDVMKTSNYIDVDSYRIYEDNDMGVGLDRRVLYLVGEINGDMSNQNSSTTEMINVIQRYNLADEKNGIPVEKRKPIWISIASEGGDVFGTWVLINAIKASKTPVYTVNVNHAFSAASYVLVAGHKRFSLRGTSHLVHSGSVYFGGQKEVAESAKKYTDKLDKKLQDWFIGSTKIDLKTFKAKAPKDWWLDDEDALKYGLIDQIVDDLNEVFY